MLNIFIYCLTLILIFSKSINTEITIDEAYSFLNYSYTGDFLNIGIANNHIFNSFLVWLSTYLGVSEFFIRLPNLIFGTLYVYFVSHFSKNNNYSIIISLILILNPYLIDFFTLSRGYGISASLLFIASYLYTKESNNNLILPLFLLSISSFTIHTTIIFLILFWIINLKKIFKDHNKITFLVLNVYLIVVSLITIYLLFLITAEKKPLYGIEDVSIINLFIDSFGLNGLYASKQNWFGFLINFLFLLPIIFYRHFTPRFKNLFFTSYLSLMLLFIVPYIFDKPYPLLRILLPFLPPILILIAESISILQTKIKSQFFYILLVPINIALVFNFFSVVELNQSIDWKDGLTKEEILETTESSCSYVLIYEGLDYVGHYYRFTAEDLAKNECEK